ncbi:selenoprotein M-like [Venturia canescens]|uniref:selenoprotein M-like n=1 Tax=Venturia canescens TaxID=32260 RepID=UPI001C9D0D5C|nr:selenoprotein M-like [Venturia canescens]
MSRMIAVLIVAICFVISTETSANRRYSRAVVESCRGCSLNRLPDVKQFIFEDLPYYDSVEFKHKQGAPPELILHDDHDEEIERLPLSQFTREECNKLLESKGFVRGSTLIKDEI